MEMPLNVPMTGQGIDKNCNSPYLATCDPSMVVPVGMLAEYGLKGEINYQGVPYVPDITGSMKCEVGNCLKKIST